MKRHSLFTSAVIAATIIAAITAPNFAKDEATGSNPKPRKGGQGQVENVQRKGGFERDRRGPGGPGGPGGPMDHLRRAMFPFWENERLAAELQLSEDQVTRLEQSLDVTRQQLESTEGSVRTAADALREEMDKDNPNLSTVNQLQDNLSNATNAKTKIILGHAVTVKTILTAEQEETLQSFRGPRNGEDGPGPRRGRGGERGGPGGPGGEYGDLRGEIRETLENGGTIADVEALLDEKGVPAEMKDRILQRIEERAENGSVPRRKGEK